MISDLVQQMDGCGGGGVKNTNFYPTTFKVQDFVLLYFFVTILLENKFSLYLQLNFFIY